MLITGGNALIPKNHTEFAGSSNLIGMASHDPLCALAIALIRAASREISLGETNFNSGTPDDSCPAAHHAMSFFNPIRCTFDERVVGFKPSSAAAPTGP